MVVPREFSSVFRGCPISAPTTAPSKAAQIANRRTLGRERMKSITLITLVRSSA
jgi:hypothetical protein